MSDEPFEKNILLVGASGLVGRAVYQLFAPRHRVVTAGPDSSDLFLDLGDCASIVAALSSGGHRWKAVVCAAGVGNFAPLSEIQAAPLTQSTYGLVLTNKLLGQVNLALAARDWLQDEGSITLVTGITNEHPIRGASGFSMANAAVEAFVKAAAIEMPRGIRINAVSPSVLSESQEPVFNLFAGFEPVPSARVAMAYLKSVEGACTGQVIKVW